MNPTLSRRPARWFAAATAALVVASGVTLAAPPAYAAVGDPTDAGYLGALTVSPTSGDSTAKPFTELSTSTGCPDGYRALSRVITRFTADTIASLGAARSNVSGDPYTVTGNQASARAFGYSPGQWAAVPVGGTFHVLMSCDASAGVASQSVPEKYFAVALEKTSETTWVVAGSSTPSPTPTETPVVKVDTTTAVAASGVTATTAVVTATVSPAQAGGTVQFTKDGVNLGAPVTVTGGQAAYTVSGLEPSTAYAIGATYSGDSAYNGSSGSATLTTADAADTAFPSVGVTVPTATTPTPTGLKMSAKPSAVTLTGPTTRTAGEVWTATGELGTVTVNDDRQSAGTPWTLNGRISTLTSGSNEIAASNVGWKPAKVGDGNGTAGAEVVAGVSGGLSSDKALATGTGSATANVTTSVGATITLNTPADAPAGDYTATLTLTLI